MSRVLSGNDKHTKPLQEEIWKCPHITLFLGGPYPQGSEVFPPRVSAGRSGGSRRCRHSPDASGEDSGQDWP